MRFLNIFKIGLVLPFIVSVYKVNGQQELGIISTQKISEQTGNLGDILTSESHFGRDIYSIGDIDDNGVTDFISCANTYSDSATRDGAAFILLMNKDNKVSSTIVLNASTLPFSLAAYDYFGYSACPMGDLDGNGITDLAISAAGSDNFTGAVYILYLNDKFEVSSYKKFDKNTSALNSLKANNYFGTCIRNYGDLDGDGNTDLLIGADFDDDGGGERGAVYILFLDKDQDIKSIKKISSTTTNFTGNLKNGDHFGVEIEILKDFDDDGLKEIAVSATFDDDGGTDRGAFYIISLDKAGNVNWSSKVSSSSSGFSTVLKDKSHIGSGLAYVPMIPKSQKKSSVNSFYIAVGSHYDNDGGTQRGSVYLMEADTSGAVKGYRKISEKSADFTASLSDYDRFGQGIAAYTLNDTVVLAVGAQYDDDGNTEAGAIYVMNLVDTSSTSGFAERGDRKSLAVSVYPNPAQEQLYFSVEGANNAAIVYSMTDVTGKEMLGTISTRNNGQPVVIDVANIPQGIYLLRIQSGDAFAVKRIIRN